MPTKHNTHTYFYHFPPQNINWKAEFTSVFLAAKHNIHTHTKKCQKPTQSSQIQYTQSKIKVLPLPISPSWNPRLKPHTSSPNHPKHHHKTSPKKKNAFATITFLPTESPSIQSQKLNPQNISQPRKVPIHSPNHPYWRKSLPWSQSKSTQARKFQICSSNHHQSTSCLQKPLRATATQHHTATTTPTSQHCQNSLAPLPVEVSTPPHEASQPSVDREPFWPRQLPFHNSINPGSHLTIHRIQAHHSKENGATHTVKPTETQPLTSPIVFVLTSSIVFDLTSPIFFELTSPIIFELGLVVEREI